MPQPEKLVWRSDLGWPPYSPADHADPKLGLVVHYDGSNQGLASKPHTACVTYWHNTRAFHTGPSRGWADVGYSFFACPHGYVLEGRGLCRYQAAQGTTAGNRDYYSVTLGCGPSDTITDAQINAVRQLREWLMEPATSISGTVKGHRDFVSTSCPGDKLYRMVRDGVFSQPARWGTNSGEDDDEMPKFREFTGSGVSDQVIPRGEFTNVRFGDGKYSLAFAGERAVVEAGVTLRMQGVPAGREVQARLALYTQVNGTWVRDRSLGVDAPVHDGGSMHLVRTGVVDVPAGRRVRLEITHFVDGPDVEVAVTGRWARVLYW